ncbi:transposase [Actinoallomurus sp. NBC_01490]|uniref:hypothetical protein n=1 Tax=Actinoallomurus sp. NBC_01490 TaxID=2903557 RepID=UPI002E35DF4B|nr:hypothetical protein [Actinoallomurus sp. NBC_01490]
MIRAVDQKSTALRDVPHSFSPAARVFCQEAAGHDWKLIERHWRDLMRMAISIS